MPSDNSEFISIIKDLIDSNNELKNEVRDLAGRLSVKEILNRRTRMLTFVAILISMISVLGLCLSGYLLSKNLENVQINANNAKINCENANSSREANRKIWMLVVEAANKNPNRTPKDIKNSEAFEDYIDRLYMPRDCNDLDRRYEIPDPPKFEF